MQSSGWQACLPHIHNRARFGLLCRRMAYPPRQLWALALSGVLTELESAHHDEIGGWGNNEHTRAWCTNTLANFYGVKTPQDFHDTMKWLLGTGHTAEARQVLASLNPNPAMDDQRHALVRANRSQIERSGLMAWDTGRLVAVVGWGTWAGYVSEQDAWQILLVAAARVQKVYDSWRAFGEGYELGRQFWSNGAQHDGTRNALIKLTSDPRSPWMTLPWTLDLGVQMLDPNKKVERFKRTVCPTCGAPRTRPSPTGYVYCDFCGALSDFDFAKACEKPLERPGPAYEALCAQLKPTLDDALARQDVNAYRAAQQQIFDNYVTMCPNSVPFRTKDPEYRKRYVAYMAEGGVVTAFDPVAKEHDAAVAQATARLTFQTPKRGMLRVDPVAFDGLLAALFPQQDYIAHLHQTRGVFAMQPDGATMELQRRIGYSMFAQAWLPMLDETRAAQLLERTGLKSEYVEAEIPQGAASTCGNCGAPISVLEGAKKMVCDHCAQKIDVGAKLPCTGCGASLSPAENQQNFSCPHCRVMVSRVQMMTPG